MKKKRLCAILFLSIAILFTNAIQVEAMNTGFSTEELSEETKTTFVSNINISPLKAESTKRGIQCFDVNEQGMIAIGQNTSERKTVCVYSNEGVFQYGYAFNCTGDFGVEWDGVKLNIYFVRSDIIISLDPDANIVDIEEVQNTIDNNTHRNRLLYSDTRMVGNTTYLIRNDMGVLNWLATSYSQIVVKDSDGTETIIYDMNARQLTGMIILICLVFVIFSIAVVAIGRQVVQAMRQNNKRDNAQS